MQGALAHPSFCAAGLVNYTNWLPNFGARYMLKTVLGVRYIISRGALDWHSVELRHRLPGLPAGSLLAMLGTAAWTALASCGWVASGV